MLGRIVRRCAFWKHTFRALCLSIRIYAEVAAFPTVRTKFWRSESAVAMQHNFLGCSMPPCSHYHGSHHWPLIWLEPEVLLRQRCKHAEQESACLLMSYLEAIRHKCRCRCSRVYECTEGRKCASSTKGDTRPLCGAASGLHKGAVPASPAVLH